MGRTTSEHRIATSRTLAAGWGAPLLLVPLLQQGGLAPLAIAAVVALLVGAPAAGVAWRVSESRLEPAQWRAATGSASEMAALLWVSCAVAQAVAATSPGVLVGGTAAEASSAPHWLGWLALPLVWLVGSQLSLYPLLLGSMGLLAVLGLLVVGGVSLQASPWTLLEPHWDSWASYAGPAAILGVLLAGVGTGPWTLGARRPPGERYAPWAAVGLGLLATLALALERAGRFESALGVETALPLLPFGLLSLLLSCGIGALLHSKSRRRLLLQAGVGVLLSGLLAGPAAGALPFVVGVLVPLLALGELLSYAVRSTGTDRIVLSLAVLVVCAAVALGWPGLPDRVFDAALLGVFLVGTFWVVATRSILARRST